MSKLSNAEREKLKADCRKSERAEIALFFRKAKEFHGLAAEEGGELFDLARERSSDFRTITGVLLIENPRLIKVFRYLTIPPLSQMKLGQLLDLTSTDGFEGGKRPTEVQARMMATIFRNHFDTFRVSWREAKLNNRTRKLAIQYSRGWTASLMASQNALTNLRNWRKDLQESRISAAIVEASFQEQKRVRRVVNDKRTISPGWFVKECKLAKSGTPQKADFIVRLKKGRMLAIEAKAIGVRIDSHKRLKEIRDKRSAWKRAFGSDVETAAVLAGFVFPNEVAEMVEDGIPVFWEHDLKSLTRYIS